MFRQDLSPLDRRHEVGDGGGEPVLVPQQVLEDSGVVELAGVTDGHHCGWQ